MKIMTNKKICNKNKSVMASRTADIVTFSELSEEQKDYIVSHIDSYRQLSELIYQWYNDDIMDMYHIDVKELAKEFTSKYGVDIDTSKIYWQSNSQGPYPEWRLQDIFEYYKPNEDCNIMIEGSGTDVDAIAEIYVKDADYDEYFWEEFEFYSSQQRIKEDSNLKVYNVDTSLISEIQSYVDAVQDFIDSVWSLVHDVCTSYPDEDWIYDMLEGNDIEFLLDGDSISYV